MLNKIRSSELVGQAFRFLLLGTVNTVVTYGIYLLILSYVGYQLAYMISYVIGIAFGYFLNAKAVFRTQTSLLKFLLFVFIYVFQLAGGAALMYLIVNVLRVSVELAPLVVLFVQVPTSFFLVRTVMKRIL